MQEYIEDLLMGMRSGQPQSEERIEAFVRGVSSGVVSRPQAAAWLAWAFARGLTRAETLSLTRSMTQSGEVLTWEEGPLLIDKHSTGGVGDKVSLVLAPLWAELGRRVPMVSGRGLGHTGGTLDKLEAIPGYRTDLSTEELRATLRSVGCFISGQTAQLAPADRVLYALRNEISAVESVPLIVGSILSKKFAAGVERLVLDVKTGAGSFMREMDESRALAEALVQVAVGYGISCTAYVTDMDQPLGDAVGNALEVEEAVACLKGEGPDDLREVTLALAEHPDAEAVLASGRAYARFEKMVAAQGGDLAALRAGSLHGAGVTEEVVESPRAGVVHRVDARAFGRAAFDLGAGRRRAEDALDMGVGIKVHVRVGQTVAPGQPLYTVVHRDGSFLESALSRCSSGLRIEPSPCEAVPKVYARVDG